VSSSYLWLKFLHIFVAVVALGTSAGLGIILEFFGNDPTHGSFVLRATERMIALLVLPGFLLMLATGLWMASLAWPFTAKWLQLALGLWLVGIASLGWSFVAVRKQRRLHTTEGRASPQYTRASITSRISGAVFGFIVVATLYIMVFKPVVVTPIERAALMSNVFP
jgi:uncharacterized membrane protein